MSKEKLKNSEEPEKRESADREEESADHSERPSASKDSEIKAAGKDSGKPAAGEDIEKKTTGDGDGISEEKSVNEVENDMNSTITEQDQLLLDQQEKIAELEKKVEELSESNLRRTAELDNVRKRVQRERIQLFETSKVAAIEHFLPVYDDLQRTLNAMNEDEEIDISSIQDGVRLIADKFREALKRYDVERIDQTGVPFNVDLHDALMRQKPDDENVGSDIVLQVLENGYKMGDRTIRHAKVIVSE